jgi:hypothetical protein
MDKQQLPHVSPDHLVRGLGWIGIALGVARLMMSRTDQQAPAAEQGVMPLNGLLEIAGGIGILGAMKALDMVAARLAKPRQAGVDFPDYSDRVGMPRPPAEMRGEARKDFEAPRDMRTPEALRPWTTQPDV